MAMRQRKARKMEITSLKKIDAGSIENAFNVEQLRPGTKPVEIEQAQKAFEQAKSNLKVAGSSEKLSDEEVEKLVKQLNDVTESLNIELRIRVERRAMGILHVQFVDTKTNEVIREIPPEKMSSVGSRLLDTVGIIIDEMA
jgi:flagellar protein FlaG